MRTKRYFDVLFYRMLASCVCLFSVLSLPTFGQLDQSKISDAFYLIAEVRDCSTYDPFASLPDSMKAVLINKKAYGVNKDKVLIEAVATNQALAPSLLTALQAVGLENGSRYRKIVAGYLPFTAICDGSLAAITSLQFAYPTKGKVNVGAVTSQGDVAQLSLQARDLFGADGSDVTVGIISNSYNLLGNAESAITSGDLPGPGNPNGYLTPVDILVEGPGNVGAAIDEGRAMAEIIHDVAPGTRLIFRTGFLGRPDFANGIHELAAAGCDIIVDDVFYIEQPFFQDGIISQAVDSVVKEGVLYFSFARNDQDNSYSAIFNPVPTIEEAFGENYIFHDFDLDPNETQTFLPLADGELEAVLQWSEPLGSLCEECPSLQNDFEVFVYWVISNPSLGELIIPVVSSFSNASSLDPILNIRATITNFPNGTQTLFNFLRVGKRIAPSREENNTPIEFKIINFDSPNALVTDLDDFNSSIVGHPNAVGAITVGAVRYDLTPAFGVPNPVKEAFSSAGGTGIYFDTDGFPITPEIRIKPDFMAPDGVNTTFFGNFDFEGDGFPNFFGTSAAAPHAAAIAALMLDVADSPLSVEEVRSALSKTALDMQPVQGNMPPLPSGALPQFDFDTGHGLLRSTHAMAEVAGLPTVLQLVIENPANGSMITEIREGEVIDLATISATGGIINLRAKAIAGKGTLGSVRFQLTGPTQGQFTDNKAPYYLFGDVQGHPRELPLAVGQYQITASPFTQPNGIGLEGFGQTLNFTVINSAVVEGYILVNVDDNINLDTLADNHAIIDLANTNGANLNLYAIVPSENVERIEFNLTGTQNRFNQSIRKPFSVFPLGTSWQPAPVVGTYQLSSRTFISKNGNLTPGESQVLSFEVINSLYSVARNSQPSSEILDAIKIYPNPLTNGVLNLIMPGTYTQVSLYNLIGFPFFQGTLEKGLHIIDLSQVPNGLYWLEFNTNSSKVVKKLLVNQ